MALLGQQQVSATGTTPNFVAASAGGDTFVPDERGFLYIKNGSGSSITVTLVVPGSEYGQARPDVAIPVPAGADRLVGPLVADLADPTDGLVHVTYSGVTSLTVAVLRS